MTWNQQDSSMSCKFKEITDVLQDSAQHGELLSTDPALATVATVVMSLHTAAEL